MHYKTTDHALRCSLKEEAKASGLDMTKLASRYTAERLVDHFNDAFGPMPFVLDGGLNYPQELRPTADADIKCIRRFTEQELDVGMWRMRQLLRPEGIEIVHVHPVRLLEISGLKDPVRRIKVDAMVGGMRGNTNIDLKFEWGPNAFSKDIQTVEHGPLFNGGPTYTALVESDEVAIAAKWLAVLLQSHTDLRAKSQMDICFLSGQPRRRVNHELIADEMRRLQKHRGIMFMDLASKPDEALSFQAFLAREEDWNRLAAERKLDVSIAEGFLHLNVQWQKLLPFRKQHIFNHYRGLHAAREERRARGELIPVLPPPPKWDNVIQFRR